MTELEQKSLITLCLMAAFADGAKDERERAELKRIADAVAPGSALNLPALYQDVLLGRTDLDQAAAALPTPQLRQLAFELAVCVCDADGATNPDEEAFLERLRTALGLASQPAREFVQQANAVATVPLAAPQPVAPAAASDAAADKTILNYAILTGALELLPQSLATMAIIPLQMKLVYAIGKAHGYELDRGHVKDFLATAGVGLTGQYVEQIGRKLIGGLLRKAGGGLLGSLGSAATGSAFSFATTYALGQVARQYYAAGRTLDPARLKQSFATLFEDAKALQARYAGAIEDKARTLDVTQIAALVRQQP